MTSLFQFLAEAKIRDWTRRVESGEVEISQKGSGGASTPVDSIDDRFSRRSCA